MDDLSEKFSFKTIARIESPAHYHYEAPRQAVYASQTAFLRWSDPVYRAAAEDLAGFERIWLVWVFNLNKHDQWHPKVRVPVPAERDCYSVFATRSPYRPNPIGISAVELHRITAQGLELGACDLLHGTAVLDVKPYIPEVDAFPGARAGWRDRIDRRQYRINWSAQAAAQADFIRQHGALDLKNMVAVQLSVRPDDRSRKRLSQDAANDCHILHCRTWKIYFRIDELALQVNILRIDSNYQADELLITAADKYGDKELHRAFRAYFPAKCDC